VKKLLSLFLLSLPLFAYIDVTPIEIGERPGLSGSAALSLSSKRGTTDKTEIDTDLNLRYDNNESFALWGFGGYKYTDTEGKSIENRGAAHFRYLHRLTKNLYPELFVQTENNRINEVDYRFVTGGDIRWRFFEREDFGKGYLGVGAIYERIRFIHPQTDPTQNNIRLSGYLFYTKSFPSRARLNAYIYYQPRVGAWSDLNLYSLAEFQTPVYKNFFLLFSFTYNYDSTPPLYGSVDSVNIQQKLSLLWKF